MIRFLIGLLVVAAIVASAVTVEAWLDAEYRPPHLERLTGASLTPGDVLAGIPEPPITEAPSELVATPSSSPVAEQRMVMQGTGTPTACDELAAEFGIPAAVLFRESRCQLDAYNPSGCGGRGCIGPAQLDAGHFAAVSPWNPNVSGTCVDLDPSTLDGQVACAARLPASAWGG